MTEGIDVAAVEEPLRVMLVPPETPTGRVVDAWRSADDRSELVLTASRRHAVSDAVSVVEHADHRLEAAGSVVPEPLLHAGAPIAVGEQCAIRPRAWFDQLVDTGDLEEPVLQTVREPADLVDTLERLLADGVCPTDDGWFDGGPERLGGDLATLRRRLESFADEVPSLDPDPVEAAIAMDGREKVARELLADYLQWCHEGRVATPGIRRLSAAAHRLSPEVADVLLLADDLPPTATIRTAWDTAAMSLTIAIPAVPSDPWTAWTLDGEGLVRSVAQRVPGIEPADVALLSVEGGMTDPSITAPASDASARAALVDPARVGVSIWTHSATDPVAEAVTVVDRLCAGDTSPGQAVDSPEDIHVVLPARRHARRFIRLASSAGSSPVVRVGTIEVFRTRIAVLSLAWLRIIEGIRPDRGWAVVLEAAGCSPGDLNAWLGGDERPAAFASVRGELASLPDGLAVITAVAKRYGTDPRATHALIRALHDPARAPGTDAVLERLATGVDGGPTVELEAPSTQVVRVTTRPPAPSAPVVVHVDIEPSRPDPALSYRPSLGLHSTRTVEAIDGHTIERAHPAWSTISVVCEDGLTRRRHQAVATVTRATDHAIVIGRRPVLDGRPLPPA